MRYAFIQDNQHIWPVRRLCSTLDVHHSGYYAWLKQPKQQLITRGALTTFSLANDVSKYFVILPALFAVAIPQLGVLNILQLSSPSRDEIAERLGFSDTSNFRKAYRHWTGNSPNQYRKKFA